MDRLTALASRLPLWLPVSLVGAVSLSGAVLGTRVVAPDLHHLWFDLNGERNLIAGFSAMLLFAAGLAAIAASRVLDEVRPYRAAAAILGALFIFMAADEIGQLHEKAEFHSGIDWQILYLPLFAAAGVLWLSQIHALRRIAWTRPMLALGALAWAVAGVLEALEYDATDARVPAWAELVTAEEILEMVGTMGFLLAFLLVVRAAAPTLGAVRPALRDRSAAGQS